ncbi:peptidase M16 [Vibrio sp. HA2012]|uniref:M16 family metallopeptidase n=1 Tax=Vibrio sp. HA2012 TaxID=1971595 RepID=UPI000C2BE7AF|nr:pitrilysin family protein [Vibrio sp. HA2012]PJC85967.1 peptidase M16 [Vibrio sp. HA2012]
MRKVCLGVVPLIALYGCSQTTPETFSNRSLLPEGITLLEQKAVLPGEIGIPYSKYQLDNGLTLILSPDHSDPLVHVDVTYHVGSAREEIGKSGFAHFFEHMMFQGSEHVGDQEHFRIITEAGGTLNGTTSKDRTNYFETVPANQLEKMLWLESDRMGFLIDAVSQRKFEIQRDTVKNERAQNYDNRPYGLLWEKMGEAMYAEGHPYSWQTIGYVDDLDKVDVNDLKAFFLRWYGPNNATLTIGGDIDTDQTLRWVKKYFSMIPQGPDVKDAPKQPAKLSEDRYVTLEDQIRQPMVMIGWPTTYQGEEHQAALDSLASVLSNGKNGLLYQELVKTEKAIDAGAFHSCYELACNFYVYAMGDSEQNSDLTPIYKALMTVLDNLKKQGVDQSKLDQIIGSAEASAVYALQSVSGKVSQLALNQTYYNQPDRIEHDLQQLRRVTPESVMSVYHQFVEEQPKVVLSVVPKGKEELAARPATFITSARTLPDYVKITDDQIRHVKADDNFDRATMPPVAASVKGKMPALYRQHLPNGIEVLGTVSDETPTVLLEIRMPAGDRYVEPGKEGLAALTAAMMQEGTQEHSIEDLQAKLDTLGSSISLGSGNYTTTITVSALEKNLKPTLDIVQEMLFKPAFNPADFERLKKQMIEGLIYDHQKPAWMASEASRKILFAHTAFERSGDGTLASVQSLTLDDVKHFYAQNYTPLGTKLVVVGDISAEQLANSLAFLHHWKGGDAPLLNPQLFKPLASQHIYLVDKPDAPQSVVRLVRQGLPFEATGEQYLTQLANFNLAGNFNSRINQNLREDKGFTYGAGGYHISNREMGMIMFDAQVRADTTVASIREFLHEMKTYTEGGITAEELAFMRLAMGQQDALKYETPGKKAQLLGNILHYSLDDDYLEQRDRILMTVSKTTLDELARKWFNPDDYQIIVVGDAKSLAPELEKLDIPVVRLEIEK